MIALRDSPWVRRTLIGLTLTGRCRAPDSYCLG